jgi:hypothetical protein
LVPEAVQFPPPSVMQAPEVRLSPKFHSCECAFNALSGWVGGVASGVPPGAICALLSGAGAV